MVVSPIIFERVSSVDALNCGIAAILLILIHMLVLLPQLQQPLKQLQPLRLQLPGIHQLLVVLPPRAQFINFLLCIHQLRMLRSSGMNLEGLRWLVSRKSMASCHLASQSSDWVILLLLRPIIHRVRLSSGSANSNIISKTLVLSTFLPKPGPRSSGRSFTSHRPIRWNSRLNTLYP